MVRRVIRFLLLLVLLVATSSNQVADSKAGSSRHNITASETDASDDDGECSTAASLWSEANFSEVVKIWKFDEEAKTKLKSLGQSLSDVDHFKNDPFEVVRFLVEFEMDTQKSEEMFRNMVEWRREKNMDTFMERYKPPEVLFYSPMFMIEGLDREGDPVMVQRHGRLDAMGVYNRIGPDAMLEGAIFLGELISTRHNGYPEEYKWQENYYEPLAGRRFTQFTVILDLDGLSAKHIRPTLLGLLKENARVSQDMFPGLSKRALVIRAPKIFRMAWYVHFLSWMYFIVSCLSFCAPNCV